MKKVAIVQSNYIPWKGYFDLIAAVDEFILYDDMQYTRRDWRNRNQIKTPHGVQWLTIPVKSKGKYSQRIRDTEIDGSTWINSHWKTLSQNYRRSLYFEEVATCVEQIYFGKSVSFLSELNRRFIEVICNYLDIKTTISNSWKYNLTDKKSECLADLCKQAGAQEYISGPTARGYIDKDVFISNNIKLTWFNYSGYLEHPQLWGEFTHQVSILDLLFNCGKNAGNYMKYVNQ